MFRSIAFASAVTLLLALIGASAVRAEQEGTKFSGNVSWYGPGFNGKKTASGEIFDMTKLTAAHKKLPFGTRILIEHPKTGKTVIVRVNDRGPYAKGRVLDLSRGAAQKLGILLGGVAFVECTVLPKDSPESSMIDGEPRSFFALVSATGDAGDLIEDE